MSYFRRRDVKAARVAHQREHCERPINVGDPYLYLAYDCEGEFMDAHVHHECHDFVLAYTCTDEGWWPLHQLNPDDEPELAEAILAEPPSEAMLARLPPAWATAVAKILQSGVGA